MKTKVVPVFSDPARLKNHLKGYNHGDTEARKERLMDLDKQIDRRLTVLHNLRQQHAWGDLTDDEYQEERDRVKRDLATLEHEREELQKGYETSVDLERDAQMLERLADQINERLTVGNTEMLRRLYDAIRLKITFTGKGILISSLLPLEELDVVEAASRCYYPPKP